MRNILTVLAISGALMTVGCKKVDYAAEMKDDVKVTDASYSGSKEVGGKGTVKINVKVTNPTKKDVTATSLYGEVLVSGDKKCSAKKDDLKREIKAGADISMSIEVDCNYSDIAPEYTALGRVTIQPAKGDAVKIDDKKGGERIAPN